MNKRHPCFILLLTLMIVMINLTLCQADPIPSSLANLNFVKLKNFLPFYENAIQHPWPEITTTRILKIGSRNKAVFLLRERLKATGELSVENDHHVNVFDIELDQAVKNFQSSHGLKADGVVGQDTLYELNISPEQRLQQIQVNITRWARLSQELGDHYIFVNVPDYTLNVIENDQSVLNMKIIVGKLERPTPEIFSTVTRLVLNPYWNVPKVIAQKDIVPKVIANPDYLDDMHIKILDRQEDDAVEINQDDIDWQNVSSNGFPYHFRQDPGVDNALGLIKFEFQNNHDIYLHDTPAKNLFEQTKRAFSSGCVRLENPFALATYLMENDPSWSEQREQELLSTGQTHYVKVAKPTPIVITYITAWVNENGILQFRDDLYGWDNNPDDNNPENNENAENNS